jgi:hypothetical protein
MVCMTSSLASRVVAEIAHDLPVIVLTMKSMLLMRKAYVYRLWQGKDTKREIYGDGSAGVGSRPAATAVRDMIAELSSIMSRTEQRR